MTNEQFFSYIRRTSNYIPWDDDDIKLFTRPKPFVGFL